jgi:hypothetical protein
MFRRLVVVAFGVLSLAPATARADSSAPDTNASSPSQESGSPINDQGSSYDYRSNITRVTPDVPGLRLEVLEFADRLVLTNRTGRAVTVYGYQGEPYARVLADGTVQVNTRSPAYFLNQDFYGNVTVPPSASPSAAPRWRVLDRTGQLEWHDHRIHWMSPALPPQVKDESKRTKIFDWQVPIRVGTEPGTIDGQLLWVPQGHSKAPLAAIVALAVIALAGLALVLFTRRRRSRGDPPGQGGREAQQKPSGGAEPGAKEAW